MHPTASFGSHISVSLGDLRVNTCRCETNSLWLTRLEFRSLTHLACQNRGQNYEIGGKVRAASEKIEYIGGAPSYRPRHEFRPQI